jgi:hypothetical protein
MSNGRCRYHGGKNPGAPIGSKNGLKHGRYSAEALAAKRERAATLRETTAKLDALAAECETVGLLPKPKRRRKRNAPSQRT